MDSAFRAWIETLEPGWVQARRALMAAGRDWLQVGFDNGAEAWRWPRTRLPYTLTGRVRTLGAQASPTLLIALPDGARIAFVIEEATVRVERHAVIGDPRPVVLTETPTGPVRSEIAFSLRVDAKGITARIGDATMGVAAEPSGRWGLAVGPAGNAVWSDVTVEPVR